MRRCSRTKTYATTLGVIPVLAVMAASAILSPLWAVSVFGRTSRDPQTPTGPVEPIERNCWDRTQWERPPRSGGRAPDEQQPAPGSTAPTARGAGPVLRSHDLTSNRGHALSVGTLQVVTFYDGAGSSRPTLRVEYTSPRGGSGWIVVTDILASTSDDGRISTYEYDLGNARLTGVFEITGIVPNGVIDGLAFGLFWRDAAGFHLLRSTAPDPRSYAALVGSWPIGLNDRSFERRTPQLRSGAARQQAKMAIYGAEYLDDGTYLITIQERAVRTK